MNEGGDGMTLGEKLKSYRTSKGLSQEKIAAMLDVSRQAVTKWEANQATPSSDHLISLAKLYYVSLDELMGKQAEVPAEEQKQQFSPKHNPILRANLTTIAIIVQAAYLNVLIQPLHTEGIPEHSLFFILKYVPLLLASVWMAFNLRYEKDAKQLKRNIRIELLYCAIMAGVAIVGHYTRWYFPTALALITICLIYILVINPKYMNRQLVRRKDFEEETQS